MAARKEITKVNSKEKKATQKVHEQNTNKNHRNTMQYQWKPRTAMHRNQERRRADGRLKTFCGKKKEGPSKEQQRIENASKKS
jgi:hypothetical protein